MGLIISDKKGKPDPLQSMYVCNGSPHERAVGDWSILTLVLAHSNRPVFSFSYLSWHEPLRGFCGCFGRSDWFSHIFVKTIGYQFYCTSLSNTPFKIIHKGSEVLRVMFLSQLSFSNVFKQQKQVWVVFRTTWSIKHLELKTVFLGPVYTVKSNDKVL